MWVGEFVDAGGPGAQISLKNVQKSGPNLYRFWDRFWLHFGSLLVPFRGVFSILFSVDVRGTFFILFRSLSASVLLPFWAPKSTLDPPGVEKVNLQKTYVLSSKT